MGAEVTEQSGQEARKVLDPKAAGGKRFLGKVAVVTGAGQGIGRATARRLAEEGATVLVADRNRAGAERTCGELRGYGAEADLWIGDVSSADGAKALMAAAVERWGRIDVLVNTVGGSMYGPKLGWEYTPEELQANVQNNFWTTMWCCWAALPYMVERQSGAIVNLGSNSPRGTMRFPYAAAKGGVFAMTTSLALETATMGIRINCVAPHWSVSEDPDDGMVTRIPGESRREMSAEQRQAQFERLAAQHLQNIPMRRPGQKEEQAAAIAFLASDDASFVTGQILSVGGGATVP
jgi:NAD(P)-dependent dehydrogenase (short-subunit alcohol dehydrogenase family)